MIRDYLKEGDLISVSLVYLYYIYYLLDCLSQAEVQHVNTDGSLSLHTRSMKYGKV